MHIIILSVVASVDCTSAMMHQCFTILTMQYCTKGLRYIEQHTVHQRLRSCITALFRPGNACIIQCIHQLNITLAYLYVWSGKFRTSMQQKNESCWHEPYLLLFFAIQHNAVHGLKLSAQKFME